MVDPTDTYCQQCGTRLDLHASAAAGRPLTEARVLARGLRNFVLDDKHSLAGAISVARDEDEREAATRATEEFVRAFRFCLTCRRYLCHTCWESDQHTCLASSPEPYRQPARPADRLTTRTPDLALDDESAAFLALPATDIEHPAETSMPVMEEPRPPIPVMEEPRPPTVELEPEAVHHQVAPAPPEPQQRPIEAPTRSQLAAFVQLLSRLTRLKRQSGAESEAALDGGQLLGDRWPRPTPWLERRIGAHELSSGVGPTRENGLLWPRPTLWPDRPSRPDRVSFGLGSVDSKAPAMFGLDSLGTPGPSELSPLERAIAARTAERESATQAEPPAGKPATSSRKRNSRRAPSPKVASLPAPSDREAAWPVPKAAGPISDVPLGPWPGPGLPAWSAIRAPQNTGQVAVPIWADPRQEAIDPRSVRVCHNCSLPIPAHTRFCPRCHLLVAGWGTSDDDSSGLYEESD